MTPASYYKDLVKAYHVCLDRPPSEPESPLSPSLFAGLNRIMTIAKEIIQRTPDRFSLRGDVIFMTMALPILCSVAMGETVDMASVEGCIQAYTKGLTGKPMSIPPEPEKKETQYCKLRGGPCVHCVDRYHTCRNYYEVV